MVKRKRGGNIRRRRIRRRRNMRRRRRRNVVPRKGPLPPVYYAKLAYFEKGLSVDPSAAGVPGFYVFRANSCFDPNYTGTGHQPRGFDQLAAFYNRYQVMGAKIRIRITTHSTASNLLASISVYDATTYADTTYLPENNHLYYRNLMFDNTNLPTKDYVARVNPAKFTGRKGTDEVLSSLVTTNPDEVVYFLFGIQDAETGDPGVVKFQVYLEQYVKFSDQIMVGPS